MTQRVAIGLTTLVFSVCCFVLAYAFDSHTLLYGMGMWNGGLAYGILVRFSWTR